jgi:hypothetical protein
MTKFGETGLRWWRGVPIRDILLTPSRDCVQSDRLPLLRCHEGAIARCPMAQGRNDDILITSFEEFRNLVMKEFYKKLGHGEKRAAETGQTILGEFGIAMEQGAEPLLRVSYICEPGKPGQVLTADGPMYRCALLSGDERSFDRVH